MSLGAERNYLAVVRSAGRIREISSGPPADFS